MSTAVPPSDSATTNMAPHLVLVTRLVPVDSGLGLGRQDKRYDKAIDIEAVVDDGIIWLADEDIQFGEVPSPSLGSLYPPSVSILPSTTANIVFHLHQGSFIYQATSYPSIKK